ncbi:MAG TPA: energy-coupling factor transporter transmembrane protein EcfT [Desulfurococcales archaeon]|nr:energy-coupling factor transporter transmembrane protein EcfT [Desulfurococcales archaeon]
MVLLDYIPKNTFFHKLNTISKLVWLITVIVLAFLFNSIMYISIIFVFTLICLGVSRIPLDKIVQYFRILLLPLVFIVGYEALTYPNGRVVVALPYGINVSLDGILLGLTFAFRLLVMVFTSTIFTYTTPYNRVITLLFKLRIPYPIIFILLIALRYIPLLQRELTIIIDAQKSRGVELEKFHSLKQVLKMYIPVMMVVLINGLRRSQQLAMALTIRGFNPKTKWKPIDEECMKLQDYLFITLMMTILIIGVYLYIQGYGSRLW